MTKTIVLTLLIWWLLCSTVPLYGQNIFMEPYNQYNLLFKIDNLSQQNLPKPKNYLIGNKELSDEYLQWLELEPANKMRLGIAKARGSKVNREVFNALYNKPTVDEEKTIREAWSEAFGIDVWYPYYKYKEAEDWIKQRLSVKVHRLKGKPEFTRDQILYVFKAKF